MSSGIIRPGKSGLRPNRDWRRFCVGKVASGGGGGGTPVDLFWNGESGTVGGSVTVADLNAGTSNTAAAAGTWTIPVLAPKVANADPITLSPKKFTVGGTPTTEALKYLLMNNAQDQIQCHYALTTSSPAASIGFALRLVINEGTFNFYNFGDITGTNGSEYAAFHYRTFSPDQAAIEDGLSNLGTLITIPSSAWYWVTMLYDNPNNSVKLRIYETSGWTQVGAESSLAPTLTFNVGSFNIGRTDNHDVFGTNDFYTDDLAICLSTGVGATFPLLPT